MERASLRLCKASKLQKREKEGKIGDLRTKGHFAKDLWDETNKNHRILD